MAAAQKKLDDANPAIIEERRQRAEDLKRVAKEDERILKAAVSANAKEIEKNRRRGLSVAEVAAEKVITDAAKLVKKNLKIAKSMNDAEELNERRLRLQQENIL